TAPRRSSPLSRSRGHACTPAPIPQAAAARPSTTACPSRPSSSAPSRAGERCHLGTKPSHRPTTVTAMSRVLIVEDEDDIAELLRFSLKLDGHEPLVAMTGEDALSQIERLRPDLVLLDLMLPDLPGTEICRRLKSGPRDRQIPVIIVTARGQEPDRVRAFELGADDFVTKPFSVRELMLRGRAVLRRGAAAEPEQLAHRVGPVRLREI